MEVVELVILMCPCPSMRHFGPCTARDVKEVVACVGMTGLDVAVKLVSLPVHKLPASKHCQCMCAVIVIEVVAWNHNG
jgi:hypothetical protein